MNHARELAALALDVGALQILVDNPVLWACGRRMPLYNDNRVLMRYPRARKLVREGFLEMLKRTDVAAAIGSRIDGVVGTATGGIAPAVLLAEALDTEFLYVRPRAKEHGMRAVVEGAGCGDSAVRLRGTTMLLVEDLISTGGSSAAAAEAVLDTGARVAFCLAIFSYGFAEANERFSAFQPSLPFDALLDFPTLLRTARDRGYIGAAELAELERWNRDPFNWEKQR